MMGVTVWTIPFSVRQRQMFFSLHDIATMTAFLCCVLWRDKDNCLSIECPFILEHGQKSTPGCIRDCFCKMMVLLQIPYFHILCSDKVLVLDFPLREDMKVVGPLPFNLSMKISHLLTLCLIIHRILQLTSLRPGVFCPSAELMLCLCQFMLG